MATGSVERPAVARPERPEAFALGAGINLGSTTPEPGAGAVDGGSGDDAGRPLFGWFRLANAPALGCAALGWDATGLPSYGSLDAARPLVALDICSLSAKPAGVILPFPLPF